MPIHLHVISVSLAINARKALPGSEYIICKTLNLTWEK